MTSGGGHSNRMRPIMPNCSWLLRLPSRAGPGNVVLAAGLVLLATTGCRREEPAGPAPSVEMPALAVPAPPLPPAAPWFTDISREAGLRAGSFRHTSGGDGRFLLPEIMASGVAMFDADGDGDLDLYATNGYGPRPGPPPASGPVNHFFRQAEDGTFTDDTAGSGLGDPGYGMGVAVGDLDNDGDLDVYVANDGPDRLYRNDGAGRFTDITEVAGIDVRGWSSSAAFVDVDRDGWLDLYVARYLEFDPATSCRDHAGRLDYCGPRTFPAVHDVLLRSRGQPDQPTFEDVSERAGLTAIPPAAGLGVVCEDLDGDGWLDIFVANDGDANHLWINRRDGTFAESALALGVALNLHGQAEAGMGVVAADLDGNGALDLFLSHQARESNTLYRRSDAGPGFRDATGESGLGTSSLPYTGFGVAALDLEFDGDLDLVIVGGRVIRADPRPDAAVSAPWNRYAEPNLLYTGDGRGQFTSEPELGGALCALVEISRGLAVGDVDEDGDLDLLVSHVEGPPRLFRNDAPRTGHWLVVRAVDPARHRDALGAQVTVIAGGRRYLRTIAAASSYQSSRDPRAHFGLGDASEVDAIDVRWPDGTDERFAGSGVDRFMLLEKGHGRTMTP
jgi:hypothetical protein